MSPCMSMLQARLLPNRGSRAARREDHRSPTAHVRNKAKASYREKLTRPDERWSGQRISRARPHPESWCTVDVVMPHTENPEKSTAMGLRSSASAPGERIKQHVDLSEHLNSTFADDRMMITFDDRQDIADNATSSSVSLSQYQMRDREHDETPAGKEEPRQSRLMEKQALLPARRQRNLETRTRAHERRRELGELRQEIHLADQEHMKLVREDLVRERRRLVEMDRTEDSIEEDEVKLKASYERLQAARDRYGPLEDTYNALEALLDRQEHELTKLEKQVARYNLPAQDQDDLHSLSSTSDDSDLEYQHRIEDLYPSYNQYMAKLGYASMLEEDLAELVSEQKRLLEQQGIWRQIGQDLLSDDQEILADFPAQEARIQEGLRQVNEEVEILRLRCIEEGLLDDRASDGSLGPGGLPLEGEQDEPPESRGQTRQTSPARSEYDRFPNLLEKPDDSPDLETSRWLIANFKSGDVGDRIERWLLHKLRCSCSEVELLARFSTSTFDEMEGMGPELVHDADLWQEEVLEFWFLDSTNRPPTAYHIQPTAMISPADSTIQADATADNNTVTLQPQRSIPSKTSSNDPQSALYTEDLTRGSPQPEDVPLPPSPLPPSPRPAMIPLPPSPLAFGPPAENTTLFRASSMRPSAISTSSSIFDLTTPLSSIPSPVPTLRSPLPSPLPHPPLDSYFSPSLIAKDMIIVGDEIHTRISGQDLIRPNTDLQLGDLGNTQGAGNSSSLDAQTNLAMKTDTEADPDADAYRVELVVRSAPLSHNNQMQLDFGLLLKIRMDYPLFVPQLMSLGSKKVA